MARRKSYAEYQHRVLILLCGTSPAVVSETLFALATTDSGRRFLPPEIKVITTTEGRELEQNAAAVVWMRHPLHQARRDKAIRDRRDGAVGQLKRLCERFRCQLSKFPHARDGAKFGAAQPLRLGDAVSKVLDSLNERRDCPGKLQCRIRQDPAVDWLFRSLHYCPRVSQLRRSPKSTGPTAAPVPPKMGTSFDF